MPRRATSWLRDPLTPRETEVIKLIAESYTDRQIAEALVISEKTVERHRANILEKLGLHDRAAHPLRSPPRAARTLTPRERFERRAAWRCRRGSASCPIDPAVGRRHPCVQPRRLDALGVGRRWVRRTGRRAAGFYDDSVGVITDARGRVCDACWGMASAPAPSAAVGVARPPRDHGLVHRAFGWLVEHRARILAAIRSTVDCGWRRVVFGRGARCRR